MWYQFNSDDACIIAASLSRYRDGLQSALDLGEVAPVDRDWVIRELVAADSLSERFYDFGRPGSLADMLNYIRVEGGQV